MRIGVLQAGCVVASIVIPVVTAAGQSLTIIAPAPGYGGTGMRGLSDDGRTAVGENLVGPVQGQPGFVWTASGGRRDFGLEGGLPAWTYSYGLSGDGGTVVGQWWNGQNNVARAFRYRGPGTFQDLGIFSGVLTTEAHDASRDGAVIVGWGTTAAGLPRAFRWTEAGGMQRLGVARAGDSYSSAEAISGDGRVIVGTSSSFASSAAYLWTTSEGMRVLEEIPGTGGISGGAFGVNSDGSIVVGQSGLAEGAIWRNGHVQGLGRFEGNYTRALGVNEDGSVVVGDSLDIPVVWTDGRGPRLLLDYFAECGVMLPTGAVPYGRTNVSGDGGTFSGTCLTSDGGAFAYVATVPSAGALSLVGVATIGCFGRRRLRRRSRREG